MMPGALGALNNNKKASLERVKLSAAGPGAIRKSQPAKLGGQTYSRTRALGCSHGFRAAVH